MESLRAQLLRIQQQLTNLSVSQKMLTVSLLAIMVMTIVWWARYAGTAQMEPVLDQAFSAADIGHIKGALDSRGITAQVTGDRVMVPADRKLEAVAMLAYADALPSNASAAWDEMTKQMSPWDSRSKTETITNHMRERMLSDVITSFFPGVAKANVIINSVSERRVGALVEPSASVQITTRGNGEVNAKRLVDAAAATVSSAVSGLSRSRVSVVIDGVPRRAADPSDSFGGGDVYEQIEAQEKRLAEKIQGVLTPMALVAVTVEVEFNSSQETRETYDAQKTVSKEKRIESETTESSQPMAQSTEPGALPNTGLTLAGTAQYNSTSTSDKSKTEMEIFPSKSVEMINKPAGKPTVVSAAVRLPRSYFVSKYKSANANAKEPDDAALEPLVSAELPTVRRIVQTCVGMKSEESISVDMYFDGATPLAAVGGEGGQGTGVGQVVKNYMKEIVVGALAVMSLFMVTTIVRKGGPAPVIGSAATEVLETPSLAGGEMVAGVVTDGHTTLDGMELDDDAVRAQQMVEQVSTMVKEDPDAAANLVKRWLNRS